MDVLNAREDDTKVIGTLGECESTGVIQRREWNMEMFMQNQLAVKKVFTAI